MYPRKAYVSVSYNGFNAGGGVVPESFTYEDIASGTSDNIRLTVTDPDHRWIGPWFPVKGDRMVPTIMVANWPGNGGFTCGLFCVDDFGFNGGPPIKLDIQGVALPADCSFKRTERTETYEKTNLEEIGGAIASRNGMALFYDTKTKIDITKVEQSGQSDCDFYSDLVEKYGLALKIYNGLLVVFSEADYESRGPKLILTPADFEPGWTWDTKTDGTYTGVDYQYTNSEKNKTFTVKAGTQERPITCNEPAGNLSEATAIALAAVNNANKATTTMTITMMAIPGLIASDCIEIRCLGRLSGKYYIEKITHSLGSGGYKMTLSLRLVEPRITSIETKVASTVSEGG